MDNDTHSGDGLTNRNLMTTDFAEPDRKRYLRKLSRKRVKVSTVAFPAPGLPASGVWMTDVSAMDTRSVKAQLAGRRNWRVAWWEANCLLHRLLRPRASLEQMMYAFHSRHHALTLAWLSCLHRHRSITQVIRQDGVMAGVRYALQQKWPSYKSHAAEHKTDY